MNAFFFGTSAFAVPILTRLAARANVTVVTQPDRPAGRGQKLAATPVKSCARALGLPVLTPVRLRAFVDDVRAAAPDRCIVASYGRIVPAELLAAVPLWFNVHPSALPLYRGATPIQSAIRDGCTTTAVSIIAMDAGMDTGDVLAQTEPLAIGADETYGQLHDRLALIGADLLDRTLDADANGTLVRVPQAERARAAGIDDDAIARTLTRPWTKADRMLNAAASVCRADQLVDLIRALAPKPNAVLTSIDGLDGPLQIMRGHVSMSAPVDRDHVELEQPGSLVIQREGMFLKAADDRWLAVDDVVPPGKRAMTVQAFLRGRSDHGDLVSR